jgi:hypothetical protein
MLHSVMLEGGMNIHVREYEDVLQSLQDARVTWSSTTQVMVVQELENWIDHEGEGLDLLVQVNDAIHGHETITLSFRNVPSGLTYNDDHAINQQEGKSGNLIKYGATLNFSFVYLGDVIIWMTYPCIREILENTEDFIDITRMKPDKINREVIHEIIDKFLAEVIAWHTGKLGKQQRIGFATSSFDSAD